jgi:hypothetical protein
MWTKAAMVFTAAALLLTSRQLFAAGQNTNMLDIYLLGYTDDECNGFMNKVPRQFVVIRADQDDEPVPDDEVHKIGNCHWRLVMTGTYNKKITPFSVRIRGVARTKCRTASGDGGIPWVKLATFDPVLQITLKPEDLTKSLRYVRHVPGGGDDAECNAGGDLMKGRKWSLEDTHLGIEHIRLPKFLTKKDSCGLLVDDFPVVQETVNKTYKFNPLNQKDVAKEVAPKSMNKDDYAIVVAVQANSGKNCHIPTQAENLIDIISSGAELRKLFVKVH